MENRGIWTTDKGKSLFTSPLVEGFHESEFPELLNKVQGIDDHRLIAVVAGLIIENRVDAILKLLLPHFKKSELYKHAEFTFSLKISIMRAFNLIPDEILKAADLIRKVRNEFAHYLNKATFDDLKPKILTKIHALRNSAFKDKQQAELYEKAKTDNQLAIKDIIFYCLVGLDIYRRNIEKFVKIVYSKDIAKKIYIDARDEQDLIFKAIAEIPTGQSRVVKGYNLIKVSDSQCFIQKIED